MKKNSFAFLPPLERAYKPPLERFIPSLPKGIIQTWLSGRIQPGAFVLDPVGSNPFLGIEAAQSGYRVLAARNNPILWLMTEILGAAPSVQDLEAVKNRLLLTRRMNETLADHLQGIYKTICVSCGQPVQADGYIWEKGAEVPTSKVYNCPNCGDQGERAATESDMENLQRLGSFKLHRNRAFHRVLQGGEYEQASIDAALDCYLPRALYVIMTLVNAMERMVLDKREKRLMRVLLLPVFDAANSLWHWPHRDTRPLVLGVPTRFLEKNLWLSLENSLSEWHIPKKSVPISYWPNLPPQSGGICLYNRRVPGQPLFNDEIAPQALLAVYPRPNQAFWTFSALWSGWLWGRKAVIPMRSALARRRYDWQWLAQAIHASLHPFRKDVEAETPLFGIFPHASPNHYLGVLAGSHTAGFPLSGAGYRQEMELVQLEHARSETIKKGEKIRVREIVQDFLLARGEPADFNRILFNTVSQLVLDAQIPSNIDEIHEGLFRTIQEEIAAVLNESHFFESFESDRKGGSRWWLVNDREAHLPLSERVESFILEQFLEKKVITKGDMEANVCKQFTGSKTPERNLIHTCIEACAQVEDEKNNLYQIRQEEFPEARRNDITELNRLIEELADQFILKATQSNGFSAWTNSEGSQIFRFYLATGSPSIDTLRSLDKSQEIHYMIVFPASRSRLLLIRMQRDPRLEAFNQGNTHLLKFRHLRWLAQREGLNLGMWNDLLDSDPPLWEAPDQIKMI